MAEFESPLPHIMKPVPVAGFIVSSKNSAKSLSRIFNYRKPRLVKAPKGWYIEYYYRIPVEVKPYYDNKEWYRFRITEDMNRRKGSDKREFADWLLEQITISLKQGYNPFEPEKRHIEKQRKGIIMPRSMNAHDALHLFLEKWELRGLDKYTISRYNRYVTRLMEWLRLNDLLYNDARDINSNHIEAFLQSSKRKYGYGNREYNNVHDFIRTAFKFLEKKKIISESPCVGIDKLKSSTNKHRYYDDQALKDITTALKIEDPYTYLAFQTVYYLCVRAEKELMNLKVGNIMWTENKILAESGGTKGSSARYIPLDENIKALFLERGIDKYPSEYYVFGAYGEPSAKPFGKEFFSKRFRKVRIRLKLPEHYTIYGAKHTRVIHLKTDGASDADIMSLTGHKDFVSYAKYLRDLGLTADAAKINKLSRKL